MVNEWYLLWTLCAGIVIGFFLYGCIYTEKEETMKIYLAEINLLCLTYGDMFLVKADNFKEAQQKVYNYCKDRFDYKESDITIQLLEKLFTDLGDVVEIH